MASPLVIYVSPNMGLEIEIVGLTELEREFDPRDNSSPRVYRITNLPMFTDFLTQPEESSTNYQGKLSPLFNVTLPPAAKETAGIPLEARHFGFMHPPDHLGSLVDWKHFIQDRTEFKDMYQSSREMSTKQTHERSVIKQVNQLDIANVCILGAFVYFDENFNLLSVNALTFRETKYDLSLSGPFKMSDYATSSIIDLKRVDVLRRELFHEAGFVGLSWVRSNEMFGNAPVTKDYHNNHGGFAFFSETGKALFYGIDYQKHVDPSGITDQIADCFQISQDQIFVQRLHLRFEDDDNVTRCISERFKFFKLNGLTKDENLSDFFEWRKPTDNGSTWNPLHYACCYRPDDADLVASIIKKDSNYINEPDCFGRYPLHVALNSSASEEVIDKLLSTEQGKSITRKETNNLKLLPLHIACSKGAHVNVVKKLVEADNYPPGLLEGSGEERGMAILRRSLVGRLPLHAAIEGSCTKDTMEFLMSAHSKQRGKLSAELKDEYEKDIYTTFRGMYPLHLLCWRNFQADCVKMVLNKDTDNILIDTPIHLDYFLYKSKTENIAQVRSSFANAATGSLYNTMVSVTSVQKNGILPLHLALRHRSYDMVRTLLKKEVEKDRMFVEEDTTVLATDKGSGKCALHIACAYKPDYSIIRMLLEMDPLKQTTAKEDHTMSMPIHYCCEDKNLDVRVLETLLEDEAEYRVHLMKRNKDEIPKKSTHHLDERGRTPLHLAIENGLSTEIIDVLLRPENLSLKGFDVESVHKLAKRVTEEKKLQERILDRISQRDHSTFLFLELYTHLVAVVTFMIASNDLLRNEVSMIEPIVLTVCATIFFLREMAQFITQKAEYFGDIWSWPEIASIVTLSIIVSNMFYHAGEPDYEPNVIWRVRYVITGSLLVLQFIFFLRATFIPFARFVGGLLLIFYTLVPFFIISGLLLLIFAYGFFMLPYSVEEGTCHDLTKCYNWVLNGIIYGNDNLGNMFDIIFGLVAIIVLLNVVIAIVSEAWVNATKKAEYLYWLYRINWITEIQGLRKIISSFTDKFSFLDNVGNIRVRDSITWTKEPYSIVRKKQQYDDPYYYFTPQIANEIVKGHSLQADMYWTQKEFQAKQEMSGPLRVWIRFTVFVRWLIMAVLYFFLIILGTVTLGLLWPSNFRRWFLSIGLRNGMRNV